MAEWIAAVSRGHNASVALLKDGEVVFNIASDNFFVFLLLLLPCCGKISCAEMYVIFHILFHDVNISIVTRDT